MKMDSDGSYLDVPDENLRAVPDDVSGANQQSKKKVPVSPVALRRNLCAARLGRAEQERRQGHEVDQPSSSDRDRMQYDKYSENSMLLV